MALVCEKVILKAVGSCIVAVFTMNWVTKVPQEVTHFKKWQTARIKCKLNFSGRVEIKNINDSNLTYFKL